MTPDAPHPGGRRPMSRAARLAIVVVAIAAVVAGAAFFRARQAGGPSAAAEAFYRLTLNDAAGVPKAMAAHRGKPVVINFWATWCVPCVQEIPAFSKMHAAHAERVAFVGLGIDSPDNIAVFDARMKPSYPLLAAGAEGTELARAFGNAGGALPYTVVLDATGRIVASRLGRVDDATLAAWIAPYVGAAAEARPVRPAVFAAR